MEQRDPHGAADSERETDGAKEHARNADSMIRAEIARLAVNDPLADSLFTGGRFSGTLIAHQRRNEMSCAGCARRRAKLKKLLDLANERFEELKQRITGTALPGKAVDGEDRKLDRSD